MTRVPRVRATSSAVKQIFSLPTQEYRSLPIPALDGAKIGDCFVPVTALPDTLDMFMEVNPRVPNRTQKGVLSGPVVKGITATLTESPDDMAIKNQGIYLLVESAEFSKMQGGGGQLRIALSDPAKHGIINGGHTYAAIRDAIESADDLTHQALSRAHVRLHILQGLDESKLPEIAEGLNRSKQVDDPSLANLQGHFDRIREVMRGRPGADSIAYNQGGDGDIYITEILVALEMFNCERFDRKRHPHYLLNRSKSALDFYEKDLEARPSPAELLVLRLPEILELSDRIKMETPAAAKRVGFEFGRMKVGKHRAGSEKNRNVPLPFIGEQMSYHVPNGWAYPMLAAFRANVDWDLRKGKFEWKVPPARLVRDVIDDLVRVCVTEHRDNNLQPDQVGKRESTYMQCYDKVQLHLLESNRA